MPQTYTLITGASNGIGKAVAYQCAQKGKDLILVARRKERLDEIKNRIQKEYGVTVLTYQVDLKNQDEIESLFSIIESKRLDALINNAGLAAGKNKFDEYDWKDFNEMIDLNVRAFTRVAQLALPALIKTQGHIINVSSVAGVEAYEGGSVYCGTKAYVKMISKALRIDLMGTGVRVTDIAPGAAETEFSLVRFKGDEKKAEAVYKGFIPLSAEDVGEAIMFALTRPNHVNIDSIAIMPTAQASATRFDK